MGIEPHRPLGKINGLLRPAGHSQKVGHGLESNGIVGTKGDGLFGFRNGLFMATVVQTRFRRNLVSKGCRVIHRHLQILTHQQASLDPRYT